MKKRFILSPRVVAIAAFISLSALAAAPRGAAAATTTWTWTTVRQPDGTYVTRPLSRPALRLPGAILGLRPVAPLPLPARTPLPAPTSPPAAAPAATPTDLSSLERGLLDLVNAERARAGLRPLVADPTLVRLARQKSQDMADRGYFAHRSPALGSAFDMMRRAGVTFRVAGENIACAPSIATAHRALMASPGHRANILSPAYGRAGIGVVRGGPCGLLITQLFTGR